MELDQSDKDVMSMFQKVEETIIQPRPETTELINSIQSFPDNRDSVRD
jgi:hypothetical protein